MAITSAAAPALSTAAAAAKGGQCPKCARRVESFAVDTNCSFLMCANVDCTWPFDCQDMGRCFEHDATVPSMRQRAKKRKALVVKDERRNRRATLGLDGRSSVLPSPGSAPRVSGGSKLQSTLSLQQQKQQQLLPQQPQQQLSLGLLPGDLSDWLADLCQQPSSAVATPSSTAAGN
ncbi:hypothetical protein IWW38_001554, partial [Coemansia aciculifera]